MSEFDDLTLREAFSQFHTDALTAVPPQDIAGVRAIARRRRATRAGAIAAMAALVLAVPVAAYALVGRPDSGPPAVRPSLSTSPSASASPSASPSASASTAPPAPDGRISLKDLGNATLNIPAWPAGSEAAGACPANRQKFTNGTAPGSDPNYARTLIRSVVYADVDHDGAQETVTLVDCTTQGYDSQVVVFDRDAAGGIVTLGQVLTEGQAPRTPTDPRTIQHMFAVRGEADGSVSVHVGDGHICCGSAPEMIEHQWRTYAWNGQQFTQTAGPTAFHPAAKPNDVAITTKAAGLTLGPVEGGARKGTFSVTVSNHGPARAPGLWLNIYADKTVDPNAIITNPSPADHAVPAPLRLGPAVSGCQNVTPDPTLEGLPYTHIECHLPGLAAGASRVYTFTVVSPVANDAVLHTQSDPNSRAEPVLHADLAEEQPGIRALWDPNRADNYLQLPLTRAN